MAPADEDATGAGRRGFGDNVEGDIMRFSELDFARLGLAADSNHRTLASNTQGQSQYPPLPPLLSGELGVGSQSHFPGQLSMFANSTVPNVLPTQCFRDQSLNHESSWPGVSMSSQSGPAQPLSSQIENRGRPDASSINSWTSSMGSGGSYHFSPIAENQQHGLPRRRSRYRRTQTQPTSTEPIDIPGSNTTPDSALDPMQRWQESPPETEPASLSAIAGALKTTQLRTRSSAGSLNSQRAGSRPGSTVSFGSGTSCSSTSIASANSATRARVTKRTRTTNTAPVRGKAKANDKRVFPCTFCCDSFKSKYDWARHEKSLHLNLQAWRCTPFGGTVVSPDTGRSHCAYCSLLDPDSNHLETHNHGSCHGEGQTHAFSRKDHLVQHLRLVHHVQTLPLIDSWKDEGPPVSSRCGFCSIRMQTWQERVDHLAKHFRKGATMDSWKGEHCFEPSIAAQVTHAMPPYLIGSESRALIPFSVTDHGTRDHLSQIKQATEQSLGVWDDGRAAMPMSGSEPSPESQQGPLDSINEDTSSMTFPEVLALHLGRYAQEQMRQGVIPTDRMFQDEARRIMFDSVDPWDQTIADNDDWLSCFRTRHLGGYSDRREDQA